jgi:putative DNA primase/helicase
MHKKSPNPADTTNKNTASDIDTRKLVLTLLKDKTGSDIKQLEFTLPEWGSHILKADSGNKETLRWLKGAIFGNVRSKNNSFRTNANLKLLTAAVVEYDKPRKGVQKAITFDEAVAIIKKAGLRALLYTSPSHKEGSKPRWRVIFPLSKHLDNPKATHEDLVAKINGLFGGQIAPESFTLSQSYYAGSVGNNPDHRVKVIDGDFLDLRDDLDAGRIYRSGSSERDTDEHEPGEATASIEKVIYALSKILNDENLEWAGPDGWNTIGMATYISTGGSDAGFDAFNAFSKKNTNKKYNENDVKDRWYKAYPGTPPGNLTFGKLWWLAKDESPGCWDVWEEDEVNKAAAKLNEKYASPGNPSDDDAEPLAPEIAPAFSEDALALLFANKYADTLRYVAAWGQWFIFDGIKWDVDEKLKMFSLSRLICREAGNSVNKPNQAKAIASAKTIIAILTIARTDRRIAASVDQWDNDLWLLNTPGGVVDLRTGKLREHRPTDYMTKVTAVTPDINCPIPLWTKFLNTTTANETDLQAYIYRIFGYSLTGLTIEQCLFFLYGVGDNGKGVLMNTAASIFCDYHAAASEETFTVSTNERHPTELAALRGARLVSVAETEQGKRLSEKRIKQLTGGDLITARFMRQDFFEFMPQFTLVMSGNHKPVLTSVNQAIRRRVNMLLFGNIISPAEKDIHLTQKLKAEWPGILAMMIEGCLDWQRNGLKPPKIVTDATEDYLATEDKHGRWLEDRCDLDPNASPDDPKVWTSAIHLFESYQHWTEASGERWTGSQKDLTTELIARGFKLKHRKEGNGFAGLMLKTFA